MNHADTLANLGVSIPDVLLPVEGVDLQRWAVVACDQHTSQAAYWEGVDALVGDAPSTLRLVFPEVYLPEPEPERRIAAINQAMSDYVERGLFRTLPSTLVLVRRETGTGDQRWGVLVAIDLEAYDYSPDSRSLVRATEGTIVDRIPPRKRVRTDAPLELPHIVVLISDPDLTVIEPLVAGVDSYEPLYDTALMADGGQVTGWAVTEDALGGFADALAALHAGLDPENPLLFAMGDGNHSLATAKSCWDDVRATLSEQERATHPARYALVEIENIFDPGLEFEPIHRVLLDTTREEFEAELAKHCGSYEAEAVPDLDTLLAALDTATAQSFGFADGDGLEVYVLEDPAASIAAGTLQKVIDGLVAAGHEVDYIHGADVTAELADAEGTLGLFLPGVAKETFFASVVADGALPRKTFSLGEAADKRYYLEARRIR